MASQEIVSALTDARPEELLPMLDSLQKVQGRLQAGEPLRNILRGWGGMVGTQKSQPLLAPAGR